MTRVLDKKKVSIVRYEKSLESVRKAVDLCGGLNRLSSDAKVFIKPNVVFWTRFASFPKWGVITTSRVIEDMVVLLKERGVQKIVIGEGIVLNDPKDTESAPHAFESLGYYRLKARYGVDVIDVHNRPFKKVQLDDGISLDVNGDFLDSDFLVDIPVMKTHAQTVVSLGIKNIKGTLNVNSRKKCHSADPEKDLNYHVAKFIEMIPPCFTMLDGIYTNERGPGFDGKMRRSNILVGSSDMFSADKVGARILGFDASEVPHLVHASQNTGRPIDLSDVEPVGEPIEDVAAKHQYDFPYAEDDALPLPMKRMGIEGLAYRKYDLSMCTYCSSLNGIILTAIAQAWQGEPWNDVEVLTGKLMKPTPGKKKTILLGKCMYLANKDDPNINTLIAVKGCPPSTKKIVEAFNEAGIPLTHDIFDARETVPSLFMKKYEGRPEFDEAFFKIDD
ncbi:MAG: DUF362 domain-containing protein [Deltaproteobacteria bacterium]|nr:DUF362 domain-containing protein [Deltaproteobacteria bacterium]